MPIRPTEPLHPSSNIDLSELGTEDFAPVKAEKISKGLAKLAKKKKAKR